MPEPVSSPVSSVDRDNPWLGLASFTEDTRAFFYGRERETDELSRLVRRQTLTVLFGQSGLGKSSLIQAGLFPILRESDHLPLYLRLDHDANSPPLAEQVKVALTAAIAAAKADAPAFRADETLWEYFHRKDVDLWSAKNRLLTPVLAFDQFEEIFTLGRASDAARDRSKAFLTELTCLVENRAPPAVQARLDRGELDPARFNYDKPSCQVILSLREDFLPDLEGLRNDMPALVHNRMRLKRLNGMQALEIVTKPGGHLVAEGVAEKIVEFVAGARGGSAERLAELDVEPPLLSVICRELNERRRTLGQDKITADLVSGNRREILHDFYERSVSDLPETMRTFVEDHLLTKSGFRDNLALETALEYPGVTRPLTDTLVSRRLLRIEDRLGVQRVELTHDVLAEVVRGARDERKQRLERAAAARAGRRQRWIIVGLGTAVCALLVGAFFGLRAQRRAEQAQREAAAHASRAEFIFGTELLEQNKTTQGLAYLVRAARSDPANHIVGPRLISALTSRNFAEPVGRPFAAPNGTTAAFYADGGKRLVTFGSRFVSYWDLERGELLQRTALGPLTNAGGSRTDPDVQLAVGSSGDGIVVIDIASGRQLLGPVRHDQRIQYSQISVDRRWLLTSGVEGTVKVWEIATGALKATVPYPAAELGFIAISPDGTRFVTSGRTGLRLWRLPDGTPLTEQLKAVSGGGGSYVEFAPDGKTFAMTSGLVAALYDGATGAPLGEPVPRSGQASYVSYSHDSTRLAVFGSDGVARIVEVPSGKPVGPPLDHGSDISDLNFTADDTRLVTRTGDGTVRVWRVGTGELAMEPIRGVESGTASTHPSRDEIVTVGSDGNVRRWRITPGAVRPMEIAVDPKRIALVRNASGGTTAWEIFPARMNQIDVITGGPTGKAHEFPMRISRGVLSPDEQRLGVLTAEGQVELWDLGATPIARHSLGIAPQNGAAARFSPDSNFFAFSTSAPELSVWNTRSYERLIPPTANLAVPRSRIMNPFSRSSRYLIAESTNDNTVSIVDLAAGKVGAPISAPRGIWAAAISSDERTIAIGGNTGVISTWDIASHTEIGDPLVPRRTIIRGLAFPRDPSRMLSWNRQELYWWDVPKRKPVLPAMPTGNETITAILSPDETRIASFASVHGELRFFDLATGAMIAEPALGVPSDVSNPITFTADGRFIVASAAGSQTGNSAVAAANTKGLTLWPTPPPSSGQPVPSWLLRLATAFGGGEIDQYGGLREQTPDSAVFEKIRAELAALPADAPYGEWGRWLLADRTTRPIGPGLKLTRAEIDQRLKEAAATNPP